MTPTVSILTEAAWQSALSEWREKAKTPPDHTDLASLHDVGVACERKDDDNFIVTLHTTYADDEREDPGITEVQLTFTRSSWAAFQAFVNETICARANVVATARRTEAVRAVP